MDEPEPYEQERRRWRRISLAIIAASLVAVAATAAVLWSMLDAQTPGAPEECRPFRLHELEDDLGVELTRPTVLQTPAGRPCHVESADGLAAVTVGLHPARPGDVDAQRAAWEGRDTVFDVDGVGQAAIWAHEDTTPAKAGTSRGFGVMAAYEGARYALVIVEAPHLSADDAKEVAARAARLALASE